MLETGYKAETQFYDLGLHSYHLGLGTQGCRSPDCSVARMDIQEVVNLPQGMCGSSGVSPGVHRRGWQSGWLQAQNGVIATMGGHHTPLSVYRQKT